MSKKKKNNNGNSYCFCYSDCCGGDYFVRIVFLFKQIHDQ